MYKYYVLVKHKMHNKKDTMWNTMTVNKVFCTFTDSNFSKSIVTTKENLYLEYLTP
jgi:hypothetical protein